MDSPEKKEQTVVYEPEAIYCEYCKTKIVNHCRGQKFCNLVCKNSYHREVHQEGLKRKKSKGIHFANILTSPRLKALYDILVDKQKHTTREIYQILTAMGFENYAIGTSASEIRHNGFEIDCKLIKINDNGSRIYEYQMI